jgi:hypothetical protein
VFGGKEACVVEVEVCESGGDVESFEAPVCCGKRGEVDVGPSGLDILIQNDEVEGGVDGVLLEEGVGPVSLGLTQCEDVANEGWCIPLGGSGNIQAQLITPQTQLVIGGPQELCVLPVMTNQKTIICSNLSESQDQFSSDNNPLIHAAKKLGIRSKFPFGCGPKFLQLVEAVKDGGGGGRRRPARGGGEVGRSSSVPALQGGRARTVIGVATPPAMAIDPVPLISSQIEGLNLEVVLPGPCNSTLAVTDSQGSEALSIVLESPLEPVSSNGQLIREATSILAIQKQVGFSFTLDDATVINNLVVEEVKDRAVMREREDDNGDQ